jgi:hypothetical protein
VEARHTSPKSCVVVRRLKREVSTLGQSQGTPGSRSDERVEPVLGMSARGFLAGLEPGIEREDDRV